MTSIIKIKKINLIVITFFIILLIGQTQYIPIKAYENKINLSLNSYDLRDIMMQIDKQKIYNHVKKIQDFGPHPTGSNEIELVGNYISNELKSYGLNVDYKPWDYKKYNGINIEATINGELSEDQIVIICAHYDSVEVSPGAEDDGSGVASILQIAEVMSKYSFNSTVKFVFFSGEEQGAYGSKIYAEECIKNDENILGVLCLDGIGYATDSENGSKMNHYANDKSDWMIDISEKIVDNYNDIVNLDVIRLPHRPVSDHRSFVEVGYAASFINKYELNPYRHTSEDKLEYMNFSYLEKICRLSLGVFVEMAQIYLKIGPDDIIVSITGSIISKPAQFCVRIENNKYPFDTVNITIDINMINPFQKLYDFLSEEPFYQINNWSFNKEITDYWDFKSSSKTYLIQVFRFEVQIRGFNDDISLYKKIETYGVIVNPYIILLIPKS